MVCSRTARAGIAKADLAGSGSGVLLYRAGVMVVVRIHLKGTDLQLSGQVKDN